MLLACHTHLNKWLLGQIQFLCEVLCKISFENTVFYSLCWKHCFLCCRYPAYKARKQLAAIDWNFHANLPPAKTVSGEEVITRKYNPRTRQWDVKTVKVAKGYEYIPALQSRILRKRQIDTGYVARHVSLNDSDPALISATIAHIAPVPTKEIVPRKSRFTKDTN